MLRWMMAATCIAAMGCGEVADVQVVTLDAAAISACRCAWVPKGNLGACRLRYEGCALDDAGEVIGCEVEPERPAKCWGDAGP